MWVAVGTAVVGAAVNIGTSAYAANQSAEAAGKASIATGKQMVISAEADTAARMAEANALVAQVESAEFRLGQVERAKDTMKMQGKADAMLQAESFNDLMAMSMVMGAASGRMLNEGSTNLIIKESAEDYNWEKLWASNIEDININEMTLDQMNIREGMETSLMLGSESMAVARQTSEAGSMQLATNASNEINRITMESSIAMTKAVASGVLSVGSAYASNRGSTSLFAANKSAYNAGHDGTLY